MKRKDAVFVDADGWSNFCRVIGVNKKTGNYWVKPGAIFEQSTQLVEPGRLTFDGDAVHMAKVTA